MVNKLYHLFQETRPSYRSQLRDTKLSSYQPRVRPSSRNFDDDKPKHNDVDSYLSRRNNTTGRTTTFSDRDKVGSEFLGMMVMVCGDNCSGDVMIRW